jgi:hypothetical protein|tara:strand:- start:2752 stop:3009 length:258 start_codon:yes stop_codon:yes gene_type:complete
MAEKKQKVRFRKGDKRPAKHKFTLSYETKPVKKGRKIVWQVIEKPTGSIIKECFFEEDADKLAKFQNKHKVWQENGGVVKHLCIN